MKRTYSAAMFVACPIQPDICLFLLQLLFSGTDRVIGRHMSETIRDLTSLVARHAKDGLTATEIPRLDMLKASRPTELFPKIYKPLVSLILQGEKRLMIGKEVLQYTAGHTFIASLDLPVIGEIVRASASIPYLAVSLTFDSTIIADLLHDAPEPTEAPDARGFGVDPASGDLVDAWLRMLRLIDRPEEIAVMAPLLEREILFRLLRGPQNAILRQVAGVNSQFYQIKRALVWIRKNYAAPFRVEELARVVGISPSAFHRRFKASTGLAPLQYQKHLRLYEARSKLFAEPGSTASVAFSVGYESVSQFTREYARMFGSPPARDIRRLRTDKGGRVGTTCLSEKAMGKLEQLELVRETIVPGEPAVQPKTLAQQSRPVCRNRTSRL